jgi:hypothetical protein
MISGLRPITVATMALVLALLIAPGGQAGAGAAGTYRVTFTNLTEGQPLTPPVVATHSSQFNVFQYRHEARYGVQQIAENGNNAPLLTFLGRRSRVFDVVQGGDGPIVPDDTPGATMFPDHVSFTIMAGDEERFLSLVSMLICTNDGFTGVDSLSLPSAVGESVGYDAIAYDARTEVNNQELADMVPPCQGLIGVPDDRGKPGTATSDPALRTTGVIRVHHGIVAGRGDLKPRIHGWTDPVSHISIERIS